MSNAARARAVVVLTDRVPRRGSALPPRGAGLPVARLEDLRPLADAEAGPADRVVAIGEDPEGREIDRIHAVA